jgi:hypothetical protein
MDAYTYADYMLDRTWHEVLAEYKYLYPISSGTHLHFIYYRDTLNLTKFWKTKTKEYYEQMTKKSDTRDKKESEVPATWGGYRNISLTESELKAFDVWFKTVHPSDTPELLESLGASGKVTISYRNGAWTATLTCVDNKNRLWTLSAFSENVVESLFLLHFKTDKYPNWVSDETVAPKVRRG